MPAKETTKASSALGTRSLEQPPRIAPGATTAVQKVNIKTKKTMVDV
jgi:hypothetical protein